MTDPSSILQNRSIAERFALLPKEERDRRIALLSSVEAERLLQDWAYWARPSQRIPPGNWVTWLILSGRGGGKTRTGAQTILEWSADNSRLALVGRTAADMREIMIEGESGILHCAPDWNRPTYEPSNRKLSWPNGAASTATARMSRPSCAARSSPRPGSTSWRASATTKPSTICCLDYAWAGSRRSWSPRRQSHASS